MAMHPSSENAKYLLPSFGPMYGVPQSSAPKYPVTFIAPQPIQNNAPMQLTRSVPPTGPVAKSPTQPMQTQPMQTQAIPTQQPVQQTRPIPPPQSSQQQPLHTQQPHYQIARRPQMQRPQPQQVQRPLQPQRQQQQQPPLPQQQRQIQPPPQQGHVPFQAELLPPTNSFQTQASSQIPQRRNKSPNRTQPKAKTYSNYNGSHISHAQTRVPIQCNLSPKGGAQGSGNGGMPMMPGMSNGNMPMMPGMGSGGMMPMMPMIPGVQFPPMMPQMPMMPPMFPPMMPQMPMMPFPMPQMPQMPQMPTIGEGGNWMFAHGGGRNDPGDGPEVVNPGGDSGSSNQGMVMPGPDISFPATFPGLFSMTDMEPPDTDFKGFPPAFFNESCNSDRDAASVESGDSRENPSENTPDADEPKEIVAPKNEDLLDREEESLNVEADVNEAEAPCKRFDLDEAPVTAEEAADVIKQETAKMKAMAEKLCAVVSDAELIVPLDDSPIILSLDDPAPTDSLEEQDESDLPTLIEEDLQPEKLKEEGERKEKEHAIEEMECEQVEAKTLEIKISEPEDLVAETKPEHAFMNQKLTKKKKKIQVIKSTPAIIKAHLAHPKKRKQTPMIRFLFGNNALRSPPISDLSQKLSSPVENAPMKSLLKKTNKKDNQAQTPRRVKFTDNQAQTPRRVKFTPDFSRQAVMSMWKDGKGVRDIMKAYSIKKGRRHRYQFEMIIQDFDDKICMRWITDEVLDDVCRQLRLTSKSRCGMILNSEKDIHPAPIDHGKKISSSDNLEPNEKNRKVEECLCECQEILEDGELYVPALPRSNKALDGAAYVIRGTFEHPHCRLITVLKQDALVDLRPLLEEMMETCHVIRASLLSTRRGLVKTFVQFADEQSARKMDEITNQKHRGIDIRPLDKYRSEVLAEKIADQLQQLRNEKRLDKILLASWSEIDLFWTPKSVQQILAYFALVGGFYPISQKMVSMMEVLCDQLAWRLNGKKVSRDNIQKECERLMDEICEKNILLEKRAKKSGKLGKAKQQALPDVEQKKSVCKHGNAQRKVEHEKEEAKKNPKEEVKKKFLDLAATMDKRRRPCAFEKKIWSVAKNEILYHLLRNENNKLDRKLKH